MDIFEFLRTVFRLVIAFLTPDILIYIGFAALALLILWAVISLVTSFENKFIKRCMTIMRYTKENMITTENYADFTAMWAGFPLIMRRNWKRYETKRKGIPSDYLKQSECIDGILEGGFFKQSRSLMKTMIYITTFILAFASLAIIGTVQAEPNIVFDLSTRIVTEALIIPIIFYLLFTLTYYVYTSIRHHQYKMTVEIFNDFVDMLDERVDIASIFYGGEESVSLVTNVYENNTIQMLREESRSKSSKERNKKLKSAVKDFKGSGLNPTTRSTISKVEEVGLSRTSNVITDEVVDVMIKNTQTTTTKKTTKTDKGITTQAEFVAAMERAEKLIDKLRGEKDVAKQRKLNRDINKLATEMTAYKSKAKKSPKGKGAK